MGPRSPSLSDGEISSEDGEKVTKNTHHRSSTSINTSPRHMSSSRTSRPIGREALMVDRNAHFTGYGRDRDRDRSRSPFRRDRSGSRSPYRADKDAGRDKRRRQEDHYGKGSSDPRRHKLYEDRPRGNYRDLDRPDVPGASLVNHDKRDPGRANGRDSHSARDRSRSPYRAAGNDGQAHPGSRQGQHSANENGRLHGRETNRDTPRDRRGAGHHSGSRGTGSSGKDGDTHKTSEQAEELAESRPQLSEAELIEQRRKKREAIRKKHAATSTNDSLLRATLESTLPSTAITPHPGTVQGSEAQSPPSSIDSPRTPMDTSSPASPAELPAMDDAALANAIQLDPSNYDEGQSAADYDPSQDANEDRPDHKRQDVHDVVQQQMEKPEQKSKSAADFDMFAEDDDDMFAVGDTPAPQGASKQARVLDESLQDNWDYPDGHYRVINGELLDGRYAVEQQIGKGTFATVVRATDSKTGNKVAIKIACRNDTMFKAGQKEMHFLNKLNETDPEDRKYIIRLLDDFMHKGHLCLVFEGLEMDLRETLKKFGRDVGINPEAIQIYARQMFLALLHMKNETVLHADLKPDNILVSSDNKMIKICDYGTATLQQDAELTPYLVSRFYRAPEVILGMDFDYAIDMWSIGCTLYELYTGRILFNGSDNNNMLRVIQECRGKLPNRLIKRSKLADNYFDEQFIFHALERDKMTGNIVPRPMHFAQGVTGKDLKSRLSANSNKMDVGQLKLHNAFIDLLDKCLQLDPEKRIKPKDALRHPFVSDMKRENLVPSKPKTTSGTSLPKGFRPIAVQRSG